MPRRCKRGSEHVQEVSAEFRPLGGLRLCLTTYPNHTFPPWLTDDAAAQKRWIWSQLPNIRHETISYLRHVVSIARQGSLQGAFLQCRSSRQQHHKSQPHERSVPGSQKQWRADHKEQKAGIHRVPYILIGTR